MFVAPILLLGSVIATNAVMQIWTKATSCSGAPSYVNIVSSNSPLVAGLPCMTMECSCNSGTCQTSKTCSNDTISTIGSVFGSKSYLQVGKTSSIIMNLLILGSYNDTSCKTLESTSLFLTETCIGMGTTSVYVSSSGELKAYGSIDCTGSIAQTVKLDTCVNVGGPSVKTSLVAAKSSASSKSSLPSLSALLAAGLIFATLGL